MALKIYTLLLLMMPFASFCQSADGWKLYINQKEIVSAGGDSVQTIKVKHQADTILKFLFAAGDTAFVKKVIVMNEQQNGIDDKKVSSDTHEAIFNIQQLYQQSNGNNISFYIVNLPADPAKAALVRVAPQLICNVHWTD